MIVSIAMIIGVIVIAVITVFIDITHVIVYDISYLSIVVMLVSIMIYDICYYYCQC